MNNTYTAEIIYAILSGMDKGLTSEDISMIHKYTIGTNCRRTLSTHIISQNLRFLELCGLVSRTTGIPGVSVWKVYDDILLW